MFTKDEDSVPCIGGCVELQAPHSEDLLPEEVVLFEPSIEEIFADAGQSPTSSRSPLVRLIFNNTPLTKAEVEALRALRLEWHTRRYGKSTGVDDELEECEELPEFVRLNALRILQYKKFDTAKSVDLVSICLQERVRRLPLVEADILPDLSSGAMYWHGRDHKCRPCLVIQISRMGQLIKDKERCVRLVIFVLEYAIRFAMVPGRVENWVVLVDLENASSVVTLYQLPAMCLTAKAIALTLESVYCCRMVWVKLLNMPHILSKVVQSVIPAEKKKKVSVVEDHSELLHFFEPNQLEARYGGTAPNLAPGETYPFHFFPNAQGRSTDRASTVASCGSSTTTASSQKVAATAPLVPRRSLHQYTSRAFHEGQLWDTQVLQGWFPRAAASSLTPDAAKALSALSNGPAIQPCRNLTHWLEIMDVPIISKKALSLPNLLNGVRFTSKGKLTAAVEQRPSPPFPENPEADPEVKQEDPERCSHKKKHLISL